MRIPRLLAATLAALALVSPGSGPARADQILGPGRIDGSNRVILPGGPTLGRYQGNKYTATPDSLQIQGPGSTGSVDGMSVTGGSPGAQPYTLAERADDLVEAIAFVPPALRNAVRAGTNTVDLRAYMQAALDTKKRVHFAAGRWRFCDKLTVATGQQAIGDGVLQTVFDIGPCFNLGASAVVEFATGDSSGMNDVGWEFDQSAAAAVTLPTSANPDTDAAYKAALAGARAKLVVYPWALDIKAATRAKIGRLRFSRAFNGINCRGNCGGLDAGLLEFGAFSVGLSEDGVFDFNHHYGAVHCWPFGSSTSPTLSAVFQDGNGLCAEIGKVDGLDMTSISTFQQAIDFTPSGQPGIARQIASVSLDSNKARLIHRGGDTQIGLVSSTKGGTGSADPGVSTVGGNLHVASLRAFGQHNNTQVLVSGGLLTVGGGWVQQVADHPALIVAGGLAMVSNVYWALDPTQARTTPVVYQTGGGLYFIGNVAARKAGGSGRFVQTDQDNAQNAIFGNAFGGYGQATNGSGAGVYGPNYAVGP